MTVKWYARRFIDRLVPGDEIPEGAYTEEHLKQMLANRMVRREAVDEPKPTAAPSKKAASKKSASAKK